MACEIWRDEVDAYVDGALSRERAREFAAHLEACASCAADALSRMQWKRATQSAGRRYVPRPEFQRKIAESVIPKSKLRWSAAPLPLWAAAAAIALAVLVVSLYRMPGQAPVLGEIADLHVSTLARSAPLDVLSSDNHTVKPWFAGKLPFTFQLPSLGGTGFTLLGGRVAYLAHMPGAQLVFQVRKHRISAFIFQDRPDVSRGLPGMEKFADREQFAIDTWSEAGLRYFLITDAGTNDLRQLSRLMKSAAAVH